MKKRNLTFNRKLILNKETITSLSSAQQRVIAGGDNSMIQVNCGTVAPANSCGAVCNPESWTHQVGCGGIPTRQIECTQPISGAQVSICLTVQQQKTCATDCVVTPIPTPTGG